MVNLPSEPMDTIATELLRKLQDVEAQLEQLKIIEERRHVDVLRKLDEATGVLEVVRVTTAAALVADTPSTTEDGAR